MIKMMIHLSERPHTKMELSEKLNVHVKSIQRMILALEAINVPVIVDDVFYAGNLRMAANYRIERGFMRRFL